ncbi:DUF885 domain-containing protein [Pseudonocardiaceae bacterium YIM PH 21723]|nr:DUF885 domain-containing protein [Pseudonocardiaceae bacterium YIM PH 21723]
MSTPRSGVHALSDAYVTEYAALSPNTATYFGIPGYDEQLTDFSPEGNAARAELSRRYLSDIAAAEPADDTERIGQAVFAERVGLDLEIHEAGLDNSALNVIASPVQDLRQIFDLMPTDSESDWAVIAKRLAALPTAVDQVRQALRRGAADGRVSAIRQVSKVAQQCDTWAGVTGSSPFFTGFVAKAEVGDALRAELDKAADGAAAAYAGLAGFLRDELASQAPQKDAVGAEAYALQSRLYLGAKLDLQEAYEWGWAEFTRLRTEMEQVAARIKPGATLSEVAAYLDTQSQYVVHGQDAYQEWMQTLSDEALTKLRGVHFDIPDPLMALECKIAPPGGGIGAYYTGPTDDFSRPGRMWWSVPADREEFSTWRELTTVYHEGVPGHHLQVATATYQGQRLNRFQRQFSWVSGHGEGWALYAERLMRELGYFEDDGFLMGMLDAQLFRAARVIVDIGMHLELPIPAGTGFHEGERFTPELGLEFVVSRTITPEDQVRDEIDRYLGWPGQAPAYKLGERLWLQARDEARERQGASFDLRRFHQQALEMGSMGLDDLRRQLAAL